MLRTILGWIRMAVALAALSSMLALGVVAMMSIEPLTSPEGDTWPATQSSAAARRSADATAYVPSLPTGCAPNR